MGPFIEEDGQDKSASWEKEAGRRNEALDCRVYARAAAAIHGMDRWSEGRWRQLESDLGREAETASDQGPAASPPQQPRPGLVWPSPQRRLEWYRLNRARSWLDW